MKCKHVDNCHNGEINCTSSDDDPKICHVTTEAQEELAPSGQAGFALLGAKDLAIAAIDNLQNEFVKLGLFHYAEMVGGFVKAINGATIIAKQTKSL